MELDLPLIWGLLIATAVMLYVLLDGMDLGIGILTGFAKSDDERNLMTATIEPVWDGNETWLILGGGGLFAAFPLAYAILMPAFYLPVLLMLAASLLNSGTRRCANPPSSSGMAHSSMDHLRLRCPKGSSLAASYRVSRLRAAALRVVRLTG